MKLTRDSMLRALDCLDGKLESPLRLIVGGGGAMLLAHHFSLSTSDIDAVPSGGLSLSELDVLVRKVATELSLPVDWLNPFFSSFAHVLPSDYGDRLVRICKLKHLTVEGLSKDDLLIMKCFAARQKDVVHARALVRLGANTQFVKKHVEGLSEKRIPGTDRALKFLSEIESFFADQSE